MLRLLRCASLGSLALLLTDSSPSAACTSGGRVLQVGFYAFFEPISYSADPEPSSTGFNEHRGYEADLLTALEAMDGAGLAFERRGLAEWPDIWLQSAKPEYDLIGGGITILDIRTRNAAGEHVVNFTSGHIAFRQTLLVRAEDAERLATHSDLTSADRVGVWISTTGELRLLMLTGLVDADGILAAGTRIETALGELVADGTADYTITAAGSSPNLADRRRLEPPTTDMPQVVYLQETAGEAAWLNALGTSAIDAIAREGIANSDASHASNGAFVVVALDADAEQGGFTLSVADADLAACIDDKINYLTDYQNIGYDDWRTDPTIFMQRAQQWSSATTVVETAWGWLKSQW